MAVLHIIEQRPGLPNSVYLEVTESLGLIIARLFATALDGELTLVRGPQGRTIVRLDFHITR